MARTVKMSGGEAVVKSLVREGVEVVFGVPGIQMYGIIAALRDEPGIRMITTRHEQATTYKRQPAPPSPSWPPAPRRRGSSRSRMAAPQFPDLMLAGSGLEKG